MRTVFSTHNHEHANLNIHTTGNHIFFCSIIWLCLFHSNQQFTAIWYVSWDTNYILLSQPSQYRHLPWKGPAAVLIQNELRMTQEIWIVELVCWRIGVLRRSRSDSLTSGWLMEQIGRTAHGYLVTCRGTWQKERGEVRETQGEWMTEWVKRVKRAWDRAGDKVRDEVGMWASNRNKPKKWQRRCRDRDSWKTWRWTRIRVVLQDVATHASLSSVTVSACALSACTQYYFKRMSGMKA